MSLCPHCGQDHAAVYRCHGSTLGKMPKDPAKQSAIAKKRWADRRHARALAIQEKEGIGEFRPKRGYLHKAEPEAKPLSTWRW